MLELTWSSATVTVHADKVSPDAAAVVVDAAGERAYPSLADAVGSDPALVVTPDTVVARVGGLREGEAPDECFFEMFEARYDPEAWVGTYFDSCWGEGTWQVQVDGEPARFHLTAHRPARLPERQAPAGLLVALVNGGYSMSTGEIGLSVEVDEYGAAWAVQWGMATWYLGPVAGEDLLAAATRGLDALWSDGVLDIFDIRTGLLSLDELRTVVDGLLDDTSYVLVSETTVAGPGFDTTVDEMFPGRVRSIEATFGDDGDGTGVSA